MSKAHDAAYRRRAGMIGALQSCICCWPNEIEPTNTGHHEACPTHAMLNAIMRMDAEKERAAADVMAAR